jgi:hypothetical protein
VSAIVPEFRVLDSSPGRTVFEVVLSPRWAVSWMFGGAIAAVLAKAVALSTTDHGLVPVTTEVRFLLPTAPGVALIVVNQLSCGSRYSTLRASLNVGGTVVSTALVTLASPDRIARHRISQPEAAAPGAAPAPSTGDGGVAERVHWVAETAWPARKAQGDNPAPFAARIALRDPLFTDGRDDTAYRYLVASDLIAPPLVSSDRALNVATVSLHVSATAITDSPWLQQTLTAHEHEGDAVGHLAISAPDGRVLAQSVQRAVLRPVATEQLPFSATGFGWGRP